MISDDEKENINLIFVFRLFSTLFVTVEACVIIAALSINIANTNAFGKDCYFG